MKKKWKECRKIKKEKGKEEELNPVIMVSVK
mgnify:CR=1 FL=1